MQYACVSIVEMNERIKRKNVSPPAAAAASAQPEVQ